jgi:thiamine pyrophosphate-dependent acetolactate synthase large subunit-like protein
MELDDPVIDFIALARSMGVGGEAVTDPGDLHRALKAAIDSKEPRVVEVFVENEP